MAAEKAQAKPISARPEPGEEVSERRGWPRYAITAMARVVEPRSLAKAEGRCTDLSLGGCYVDSINPFPKDSAVRVSIWQGSRSFESEARVVFSQVGMGMGLMFTEIEPAEREKLQTWLHELHCGLETVPSPREPAAPYVLHAPQPAQPGAPVRAALMHLIDLLARKQHISTREAEDLLRELLH
jgi:hypothetical protein